MPIGGVTILWNEASPAETDVADAAPIRSIETSIRNAMDSEHNWPSAGGASTGYHRFGSARPFYDVQSNVSSSGTDGRLLLTSDTSRLFGVGSGGTVYLGGAGDLSMDSFPGTVPQRHRWAVEMGIGRTSSVAVLTVTFPNSGFSGVPFTFLQAWPSAVNGAPAFAMLDNGKYVAAPDNVSFTIGTFSSSGASLSLISVNWFSVGTRVL